MTKRLLEDVQICWRETNNICDTSCKLFIGRQIMIVKTPDHKKID
jgi:hypothetical protein